MKQSEFIANLRETNGGKNHPRQMLIDIYNSILAHPFKLLEDYDGDTVSGLQWRSLLKKARRASPYISTSCAAYNKDMFSIILGCPIIAAISVVFDTTEDEAILQKALGGFNLCAEISAYYNLGDIFDNLVRSVFLIPILTVTALADLQKAIEEMGSSSGKNSSPLKDPIPEGLPATWLPRHFLGRRPAQKQKRDRNKNASSGSVFSGFTFIGTGGWFEQVPEDVSSSPEDLEAEQATMDCIANCNINSILLNSWLLQADSLVYLLKALIIGISGANNFPLVLVYEHFSGIIMPSKTCMPLVERAIMDLSLLCIKLVHNPAISDQVLRALQFFMKMNSNVYKGLIEHIVSVLATIIHGHSRLIT
ncbi:GDP/GTP exchange factor for ARF [Balamuthia mandrillaris]